MMTKEIIIEINPEGEVKIEGKNFNGMECDKFMKAFEDALGVRKGRTNKPEYYSQNQKVKAGQK
ncbi:MAG: DUF2997 domain-containing protein [Thermoplasmata archaeon]|nr:DUF2997 domain-containing protein [Thermoplasmata archaeon]